jgi:serine/threonine protein kinase
VAIGTPDYMSPEQARADRALNGRTDQWSLATVLFELLTARPPFVAQTATLVLTKIITEQPPRIELFVPDIHPKLATVIHRALETDRDKRYPDMAAFAEALTAAANEAGIAITLPEVIVSGEGDVVRRRQRNASAEVRAPGLPRAPSADDGSNEPPTTLFTAPTTAMPSPQAHSPLSMPPASAQAAPSQYGRPAQHLNDSDFVDPRRGIKIAGALFVALMLAALAYGAHWYRSQQQAPTELAPQSAGSGETPSTHTNSTGAQSPRNTHTNSTGSAATAGSNNHGAHSNNGNPSGAHAEGADAGAPRATPTIRRNTRTIRNNTRTIRHNTLTIQRQYRER